MKQAKPKNKSNDKKREPRLKSILNGNIVSSEFLMKHWVTLFVALAIVMIYIASKYECMTKMEEMRSLEQYLDVVKSERIRERSTYMSRIRESAMQHLADSIHPGLCVQEQPPFTLTLDPQN
jgi:ascorbate-specific PTS system EIIC-type component UlaA